MFVHAQLYQIEDMAAHLYLRIKQTLVSNDAYWTRCYIIDWQSLL